MKKFGIKINGLKIHYNHYLSDDFVNALRKRSYFKKWYPLRYWSRKFNKPTTKWKGIGLSWWLDGKLHRIWNPAIIWGNGYVEYYENGRCVM